MRKIVIICLLVVGFSGCMLDEQLREEEYYRTHPVKEKPVIDSDPTTVVYKMISCEGVFIYVTIDENNDVYDLEGNFIISLVSED